MNFVFDCFGGWRKEQEFGEQSSKVYSKLTTWYGLYKGSLRSHGQVQRTMYCLHVLSYLGKYSYKMVSKSYWVLKGVKNYLEVGSSEWHPEQPDSCQKFAPRNEELCLRAFCPGFYHWKEVPVSWMLAWHKAPKTLPLQICEVQSIV